MKRSTQASRPRQARRKPAAVVRSKRPKLGEELFELEVTVLHKVCKEVDTPRSLAVYLLSKHSEWDQYLELTFPDPLLDTFADDYLVSEMMSKNPRLPIKRDRKGLAIQKFQETEVSCWLTNARLRECFEQPAKHHQDLHWISQCQAILHESLGPLSRAKLQSLDDLFRFGPGATSSVSGKDVLASKKYVSRLDATPRLAPFVRSVVGRMTGGVSITAASMVTTVPKNAKVDRTICIEPHANIYYQLGVGALLRSTLVRLGLDPNHQERNRFFAEHAVERGYATIDLSSASDTIAWELVFRLFPDDWFHLLLLGRTDRYCLEEGGRAETFQKFSSMGNGYTWELESLIFYCIARTLTEKPIAVFGDDLVVPVEIVDSLIERLEFCGFKTNTRKSFWQGDFRESCGTDWWRGLDVRPFYLRKETKSAYSRSYYAISVANAIRLYSHRRGRRVFCDSRFLPAWLYAKRETGKYQRSANSFGYGDDGLIKNFDEAIPSRLKHGHQGYRALVYTRRGRRASSDPVGAYLAALDRGPEVRNPSLGWGYKPQGKTFSETIRGSLRPPSAAVVPVFDWYHLGPWA